MREAYEKNARASAWQPKEPGGSRRRLAGMRNHRPFPRHRRAAVLVALLGVIVTAAGCSRIVSPRTFTASAELTSGATVTVKAIDKSGRVTNFEFDPAPAIKGPFDAPFNDPADSRRLVVPWVGGSCDRTTSFVVDADAGGHVTIAYSITVAPGACDLVGIGHQLVLETDPALPAAMVTLTKLP